MTSTPVKNVGAVTGGTSMTQAAVKTMGNASFEAVWNRQTDKNSAGQALSENSRTSSQKDNTVVRDSLKAKDVHKNVMSRPGTSDRTDAVEETKSNDLRDMKPGEWEKVMEVLGTAAAELIQQIADSFGIQPGEVQGLMTDLGMSQLDLMQPDRLTQLLLMAGGAEDMTALLTDGELYQQYQNLMSQAQALLNDCSDTLQMDAEQLVDAALTQPEILTEEEELPIEVTVETENPEDDFSEEQKAENAEQSLNEPDREQIPAARKTQNTDAHTAQENQEKHAEGHEQQENMLIQELHTKQFTSPIEQMQKSDSVWDADTQNIMRQIMDFMKIQVRPDLSDLEMQLHPANLGTLQIHVASKGGAITAQFVTQNENVKAVLESQMVQLKESFAEQGVKVDAIEVTVQAHQFEQNLEQGRGRQQSGPDRRNRTRRIQLEGTLNMADLEAMDEEEQMTAQMMEANGNTVDYTA